MLSYNESRFPNGSILDYPVLPSEKGFIEEGMPLVLVAQNGQQYVSRPTGGSTDQFVGIAFAPRREITAVAVMQRTFEITSSNTVYTDTEHNIPTVNGAQTINVWKTDPVTGVVTAFTANSSPAAGEYQVVSTSPLKVAFATADAGFVTIMYNYIPTYDDVTMRLGWHGEAYGGQSIDYIGTIPVLTRAAQIVTDKFVAGDAWFSMTTTTPLYITTGGFFTLSSTGATNVSRIGSANAGPGFCRLIGAPNNAPDNLGSGFPGITISVNM